MQELGLVLLLIGLLVAAPWLLALAPWEVTFGIGVALIVLGMGIGVPAGAMYHWRLWQATVRGQPPAPRWWLKPTGLHERLRPSAKARVLRWFYVGALGFVIAVLGCALTGIGVLRSR